VRSERHCRGPPRAVMRALLRIHFSLGFALDHHNSLALSDADTLEKPWNSFRVHRIDFYISLGRKSGLVSLIGVRNVVLLTQEDDMRWKREENARYLSFSVHMNRITCLKFPQFNENGTVEASRIVPLLSSLSCALDCRKAACMITGSCGKVRPLA